MTCIIIDNFMHTVAYTGNSRRRASIDEALLHMIVTDLQPVSVVEDKGFKNFVKVLDPKYCPPSRRTIMREYLPHLFDGKTFQCSLVLIHNRPVDFTSCHGVHDSHMSLH